MGVATCICLTFGTDKRRSSMALLLNTNERAFYTSWVGLSGKTTVPDTGYRIGKSQAVAPSVGRND